MIRCEFDPSAPEGRILLRPNRSWTWRANTLLVGTLMAVSGSVATVFAYQGLWLVLPFTVLEMSVLLGCLYYCVRRTHIQEVLTFSPELVQFERGVGHPKLQVRFQRFFARFQVETVRHPWYPKRVALRCGNSRLRIGGFLGADELDELISALRDMVQRMDAAQVNPPSARTGPGPAGS
ncbi:MAG: DUF2244 domain-containing protein [Pseudomonadales bacterium]